MIWTAFWQASILFGWAVLRLYCWQRPLPRELEPVLPRLEPEAQEAITRNRRRAERARWDA